VEADLNKRLDELIKTITTQNQHVQEQKQSSNPAGWIAALITALMALIGIGIAAWLASRKAKELAAAKTELEQQKVTLEQTKHEADQAALRSKKDALLEEAAKLEATIKGRTEDLRRAEEAHKVRQKQLEGLHAWDDINAA